MFVLTFPSKCLVALPQGVAIFPLNCLQVFTGKTRAPAISAPQSAIIQLAIAPATADAVSIILIPSRPRDISLLSPYQ